MAQRYTTTLARGRMAIGTCPECGTAAANHSADLRFWIPRGCDLTPDGVQDRIEQYKTDINVSLGE